MATGRGLFLRGAGVSAIVLTALAVSLQAAQAAPCIIAGDIYSPPPPQPALNAPFLVSGPQGSTFVNPFGDTYGTELIITANGSEFLTYINDGTIEGLKEGEALLTLNGINTGDVCYDDHGTGVINNTAVAPGSGLELSNDTGTITAFIRNDITASDAGVIVNGGAGATEIFIDNAAAISGGTYGVEFQGAGDITILGDATGTAADTGLVQASSGVAISAVGAGGDVVIGTEAAPIGNLSGFYAGINAVVLTPGFADISVYTAGTIAALGAPTSVGIGAVSLAAGTITVETAGDIQAMGFGITAVSGGGGDVTVIANASITGGLGGIIASNSGDAEGSVDITTAAATTISALIVDPFDPLSGTAISTSRTNITPLVVPVGDIIITNAAALTAASNGIYAIHTGAGDITIGSSGSIAAEMGINVAHQGDGDVEVTTTNSIDATVAGIAIGHMGASGAVEVTTAAGSAITVTGPGAMGIVVDRMNFPLSGATGDVTITNGANITTTDLLIGMDIGIWATVCDCTEGTLTVLNSGSISATTGINAFGSVDVTVRHLAGDITSADVGIIVDGLDTSFLPTPLLTVEVASGASVVADIGIAAGDPMFPGVFNPTDITIGGSVEGTGGVAMLLSLGQDRLTLQPDYEIIGAVVGSDGDDTLILGGDTGTDTFDLGLMGGQFSSFQSFGKAGASTWTVTGNGLFATNTVVSGGTLLVNGTLTTMSLTVDAGATLGGEGTVSTFSPGAVTVNGTLAAGNSPGTLTVDGDLIFGANGVASFELNNPGVIGSVLNDLVTVNGNLSLDGTLAITAQASGYYRLFDYSGLLDGAFVDMVVSGNADTAVVDDSTPGQVNVLVGIDGQVLQFWDGTDVLGNGLVDGGTATWTAATHNWTSSPGAQLNGPWESSVGIFMGAAGSVDVDGTQLFDTLQFVTDGYVLGGDTLQFAKTTGGTIVVDQGVSVDIANVLAGGGGLYKLGEGTLVLLGESTYSGATTISSGTLVLAAAQRLPTATDVIIGGAGTFDLGGFNQTVASLSGTGAVDLGAGTLTLTGGGADTLFSGAISGTGGLTKNGANTLALTGTSTYSGATAVNAGALVLNGSIANSVVTIAAGASLSGSGTLGGLINAGTVAPGNSVGTLTVEGDVAFAAGSTYAVEINPSGGSDLIEATGIATLGGGTVTVTAEAGSYTTPLTFTVMTADGGVFGAFDGVTDDIALLDATLAYDPDAVLVTLERNDVAIETFGLTPNQRATGAALDDLGDAAPYLDALIVLAEDEFPQALDALSGEVHASVKGVLVEDSRYVRDAAIDRVRQAFDALESVAPNGYAPSGEALASGGLETGVWARAFGAMGTIDSDGNAAQVDHSTGGLLAGADGLLGDWRLGLLATYGQTVASIPDRLSDASSTDFGLGIYGGTEWDDFTVSFGAAYVHHAIETTRTASFPGVLDTYTADYAAGTAQAFGEIAKAFDFGATTLEPFANLAYVNVGTGGFTEEGDGPGALSSASSNSGALFATLGLRASAEFILGDDMLVTLSGSAGWRHAFADLPVTDNAFAGGTPFVIAGAPLAHDAIVLEAEIELELSETTELTFAYSGQIDPGAQVHSATATFAMKF